MTRVRRSHPPTLITLCRRTLLDECRVAPKTRIVVAVSGGGDSQALLHVLAGLAPKLRLELFAHGVDHGLRAEARAELELARALAAELGVPFSKSKLHVESGGNLMARARAARYRALRRRAAEVEARFIATAHHADDRAETVLERLLRGAGPRGLAVMPPCAGDLLRPFVRARKSDVLAHLTRHAISFASDPSNEDPRFMRVRLRRELLPLLWELSPRVVDHLTALADQLGRPEPPEVLDENGRPLSLGRAQLAQLGRIAQKRNPRAHVQLPGGRRLFVDPASKRIVLGAAKRRKSD